MIIQSRKVYIDEQLRPAQLELENGKIRNVLPYGNKPVDADYGDNWVLPGLIDIHSHGYNGGSTDRATREWVREWKEYLPSEGVTALTTLCPS